MIYSLRKTSESLMESYTMQIELYFDQQMFDEKPVCFLNLASCYMKQGKLKEAETLYKQVSLNYIRALLENKK